MPPIFYIRDFFMPGEKVSAGYYLEQRENTLHTHEFWEISYVLEGRGEHHTGNAAPTRIIEGDFLLISPCAAHCIISPPPERGSWVRVCNVLITPEYMNTLLQKLCSFQEFDDSAFLKSLKKQAPLCEHMTDDSGSILHMMTTLTQEYKHALAGSDRIIENELQNLLIYIVRLYENKKNGNPVAHTKKEPIDDLIKFISSNFGASLTLDFLAEYVHLSPEYLSRYFKHSTGQNLSAFIAETRIKKAKYMLRTGNQPIREIAEYCGYNSISSFEKAFKKLTGMTAGAYRKCIF